MDWVIEHNGVVIWASNDPDPQYALDSPTLKRDINSAGELTFRVPLTHPAFDTIGHGQSWIMVRRDGVPFWRGRAFKTGKPLNGLQAVEVAGALTVLGETDAGPWRYKNASPATIFHRLVNDHNAQATIAGSPDAPRRFTVGVVDQFGGAVYERAIDVRPLPSTWDALQSRTFGSAIGGYLTLTGPDLNVLNWVESSGPISSQELVYGENILGLSYVQSSLGIVTAVEPFGAEQTEGAGDYLELNNTVSGAQLLYTDAGGRNHFGVYDGEAEAVFGRRKASVFDEDVKTRETLLKRANDFLSKNKLTSVELDADVLDKAAIDVDVQAFDLGHVVRVSIPHLNIHEQLRVTSTTHVLSDVTAWSISLGASRKARIQKAKQEANKVTEFVTSNYKIGEALSNVRVTLDDAAQNAADAVQAAQQALVNAGAALLATDDLVRDPIFNTGLDNYAPPLTLNSIPPSGKPLPSSFTSSGLAESNTSHVFGSGRTVIPGHTYRFSAWVCPEAFPTVGGEGQAPEPSFRFMFRNTDSLTGPTTVSPWIPIQPDLFTYVEWDWFCSPDQTFKTIRPIVSTESTGVPWYITGFHIRDITAVAQTEDALQSLQDSYNTFVEQTVASLIDQTAHEIRLEVSSQYVATNEFATRWANEMSSFTVGDSSIQMLFERQDLLQTSLNGVTSWQADAQAWIKFSALGIDMGQAGAPYRIHIDTDDITFYEGDIVLAQFSNQQLTAVGIVAQERLRFGPFEWRKGSRTSLWNLTKV